MPQPSTGLLHSSALAPLVFLTLAPTLLLIAIAASAQDEAKDLFCHDFRGKPLPPELTLFQVEKPEFVKAEPAGLRITLPATYKHRNHGVGCQIAEPVRGDFEITATFELLDFEPPAAFDAGVGLSVEMADTGVQIRRTFAPKGKQTLVSSRYYPTPEKKAPTWERKSTPCFEPLVKVRLKRVGATVHYLWAPGAKRDDFEEIHQSEFGKDDIERVRLFAFNNQQPCLVDVRLIDLRIRRLGQAAAPAPEAAPSPRTPWLAMSLVFVLGILLLLTICIGAWLLMRSRKKEEPSANEAEPDNENA